MRKTLTVLTMLALAASARAHEVGDLMAAAAKDFLNSLDDEKTEAATFELDDEERVNWHYIPIGRKGLAIKDMDPDQQLLAHGLLSTGLSHTGYLKAIQIMSLEHLLWELENHAPKRDPEDYHVWIFGKPDPKGTWGWRFEGHHLSLNFTMVKGELIAETPAFWASNPGVVKEGKRKGLRVLAGEEDLARELVKSLSADQKKKAVIAEAAPKDILTKDLPKVGALEDKGIPYGELNEGQQKQLWALIDEYLNNHHPTLAAEERKVVKAEIDAVKFAWAGGFEFGEGHYYYVQGKTWILEYCNTQNEALHPHAAWRKFGDDFGRDMLREHLKQAHAGE
ncbi:MAG: hypothetical protein ACI8UO_002855 [Verrucomicrobiales bacterium]|jgi:hypothetical protein